MESRITVKITKIRDTARLPEYATNEAAGADLFASITSPVEIPPGGISKIPCGIIMEMPLNSEGQIRPRSGLAIKHGITVLNSPGTIDSDYRGEIGVILINHGTLPFVISNGDRIAQMVVSRLVGISFQEVENVNETERGAGGFGSTGM